MYYIQLLTSGLLANLAHTLVNSPRIVVKTETVTVTVKDPHGLVRNDLEKIESYLPRIGWKKGDTPDDVAFRQGQHELFRVIKERIVKARV